MLPQQDVAVGCLAGVHRLQVGVENLFEPAVPKRVSGGGIHDLLQPVGTDLPFGLKATLRTTIHCGKSEQTRCNVAVDAIFRAGSFLRFPQPHVSVHAPGNGQATLGGKANAYDRCHIASKDAALHSVIQLPQAHGTVNAPRQERMAVRGHGQTGRPAPDARRNGAIPGRSPGPTSGSTDHNSRR